MPLSLYPTLWLQTQIAFLDHWLMFLLPFSDKLLKEWFIMCTQYVVLSRITLVKIISTQYSLEAKSTGRFWDLPHHGFLAAQDAQETLPLPLGHPSRLLVLLSLFLVLNVS